MLYLFSLANLFITLAYLYLAFRIVPKIRVNLRRTKIGGVGFFLLCAATHTDMWVMALLQPHMTILAMATSWHMNLIHIPQAFAIWMFVSGLFIEVGDYAKITSLRRKDDDTA